MACMWACLSALLLSCLSPQDPAQAPPRMLLAQLSPGQPAPAAFAELRAAFCARNPGHDLEWQPACRGLATAAQPRVAFVQGGSATVQPPGSGAAVAIGDLILLRAGTALVADAPLDLLVFTLPDALPDDLPPVIRPDHDPRISDTPGGCATEAAAYRRLALTWEAQNGPYRCRALNAHRVNVRDSFTHYHPRHGGFDEFYLVQGTLPGARLLTSDRLDDILAPEQLDAASARTLLQSTLLRTGDLVYLPRGVVHRGLGGVLAQVITLPGFVPGAEVPVDRELLAIRERFELGADELPVHIPNVPFVSVRRAEDRLVAEVDGEPFAVYLWAGRARPCFQPVHAPGGLPITRGWPLQPRDGESRDHPHHQGLWFTHGSVDGVDFWAGKDALLVQGDPEGLWSGPGAAGFRVETAWTVRGDGGERVLLRDRRAFRLAATPRQRTIDCDVELQAPPDRAVRLGDTKEGTFALRIADALRAEGPAAPGTLEDSEGRSGRAVWGKNAQWIHAHGVLDGVPVGVALIDHPQNLRHPTTWHARTYGLLAANPFGLHDFTGAAAGTGDVVLEPGQALRLRYRLLVYRGAPDAERVRDSAADFAAR